MATVFIVRPFGNRPVSKKAKDTGLISTINFDFDNVEKELIRPAMNELRLTGGTTGEVFAAGDIREDMFTSLLLADLVIADITVYNANVFYELGIRHALRDKRTVLIKCPGFDDTPFDIIGYRYLSYNKDNPAAALPDLIKSIDETMKGGRKDSPVFNVLPLLKTQDPEKFLALPEDFIEEVKIAEVTKAPGKLALLAAETDSCNWKLPALRYIGEALFKMKAIETAKVVWESLVEDKPGDTQANDRLATIYQRLADSEMKTNPDEAISLLVRSDFAIEKLINDDSLNNYQKAEAYSLKARNAKTRWINSWKDYAGNERFKKALQSMFLETAFKNYERGFNEDLNHFYSGINALGLLTIMISLAEKNPDLWQAAYETSDSPNQKLNELKSKSQRLSSTVRFSIEAAKTKLEAKGETDTWLNITEADYTFLTATNPIKVENNYTRVLQDAGGLNLDATVRQLKIYEALEVLPGNINAAFNAIPKEISQPEKTPYCLLFTGHMIDKAGRAEPRFPPAKEAAVKQCLKEKIIETKNKMGELYSLTGIAGGACGGDILFHEICKELEIPTQLYLALPRNQFIVESVSFAGITWLERFDALYTTIPHPFLSQEKELPKWLGQRKDYDIWTRNNLWQLNAALVNGGINMTLLALWDGKGGDGPGGTAGMVKEATSRGAKTVIIDINQS